MSLITIDYCTECDSCHDSISVYYIHDTNKLCCHCLCKQNGERWPTGIGCYVPCKICIPPLIRWYHRTTFGKVKHMSLAKI